MINLQNKIDRFIQNANNEFSENRNVISALVEYHRAIDVFDYVEHHYKIQYHETLIRISICYDILGNYTKSIEYISKAISIVPNISALILYKAILLQSVGQEDEAQKTLIKYKQICPKYNIYLYETFRLVFFYIIKLESLVLLKEINEYLSNFKTNSVVLYLKSMVNLDMYEKLGKDEKINSHPLYVEYKRNINKAIKIESNDVEFLLNDGITKDNLTKLFFMILPEMDAYQPKPLVTYSFFHSGFKLFYVIIKAVKMLKVKLIKKRIKSTYNIRLKQLKSGHHIITDSSNNISNNNSTQNNINNSNHLSDNIVINSIKKLTDKSNSSVGSGTEAHNINTANKDNAIPIYSINDQRSRQNIILEAKSKTDCVYLY